MALFQTWDPYRALDPCLFDLALNLRGTTNVIGRIFQDRKTAASLFLKQKVEERADPGLLLAEWLAGATCRWKAAQTHRSCQAPSCLWLKAVLFYFRLFLFRH